MSHYYMRDHFGDYCTHYNRGSESYWHRCNAYPNEREIFDYGCSSSCDCGFINSGKGFWNGIGAGIGLGLGSMFGGFFGGFLSPIFGGIFGMPMFSNYGTVPDYASGLMSAYTSSITTSSTSNSGNVT